MKERLLQYINEDEIYQDWKQGKIMNISDFELYCIKHCKDIEELIEENKKYKEVIDKAIDLVEKLIKEYKLNYGDEQSKMLLAYETLLNILKEVE